MTLDDDKLLVRLYQVKVGELEEQLRKPASVPHNFSDLMEELEILRALEIVHNRMRRLERLGFRCNDEPVSDTEGSSVHPAPISS
jgi:hypothetical protein